MPIIDAHAHIYPDKIAARAVAAVGKFYCYDDMYGCGTPDDLLSACKTSPITHFIVHSAATTARSVPAINSFIAEQCAEHPEFIGFGTMHPDFADMESEVQRAQANEDCLSVAQAPDRRERGVSCYSRKCRKDASCPS